MITTLLNDYLKLRDESVLREQIRADLTDWASNVMAVSGLSPSVHHRLLLNRLDLVSKGKIRRLLVLMPPGSAKSTYASIIFPIWWFIQHPRSSVIAVSHTTELVKHFSRSIHALIAEHHHRLGFDICSNDRSACHWRTTGGGEYYAVGIRGAITGRRADLVIVDDPIKSMWDAESPVHRRQLWDWYLTGLTPRLKPDARVVVVMTRWHDEDFGGQLTTRSPQDWHILRLPALAEPDDPIGRPVGAPLWPEWEDLASLDQKKALVGSRTWSALFQQAPQKQSGAFFKVGMLQATPEDQATTLRQGKTVRAWDLAATAASPGGEDPDWTVGLKLTLDPSGRYVVEDIVRLRGNYGTIQDTIISTARSDGHSVIISLPIDPGQAGKSQISHLSTLLSGYRIYASREQGSKLSRAMLVSAQVEAGNVCVVPGPWYHAFIDELSSFPQGTKDDQVDALSRAFLTLSDLPKGSRRVFIPYNIR